MKSRLLPIVLSAVAFSSGLSVAAAQVPADPADLFVPVFKKEPSGTVMAVPSTSGVAPPRPSSYPELRSRPQMGRMLPEPQLWGEEIDGLIPLYGGEANFKEVLASVRVELVKLKAKPDADLRDNLSPFIYEEVETKVLASEDAKAAIAVATTDATYAWGELPECSPDYGFRLKFRSRDRVVLLDLCFTCRVARVAYAGKEVATVSFDPAHKEFTQLVESYFKGALEHRAAR